MKKSPFSRFESMAQRLIEGSFRRLLGGELDPLELWSQVAQALERSIEQGQVASHYQIHLNPADYNAVLAERPEVQTELADYLLTLTQRGAILLPANPEVELISDLLLPAGQVYIETGQGQQTQGITTQIYARRQEEYGSLLALRTADPFLIVDGRRHVALDKPIIQIGRRMENDLVLDSATVSRSHAQLRWRLGHFVLYDLSNRGRTAVNHQPITEHVLKPGDVITLSDVTLIYGEGRDTFDQPNDASEDEEPTQVFSRDDD
ncbi:MAG: FhaA domain-containing protein [Chloroflexota bacterium]